MLPPGVLGLSAPGCREDLGKLGPKCAREQGQALACKGFIGKEVLDDCGGQSSQRVRMPGGSKWWLPCG